jgi:RHS repeat-associated protein
LNAIFPGSSQKGDSVLVKSTVYALRLSWRQCVGDVYKNIISAALVSIFAFFSSYTFAQAVSLSDAVSRPIPGAGHDYIHQLSETVNPANGSLSIKIDLPSPKGRGLTLPVAITYDSGDVHNFLSWGPGVGSVDPTVGTAAALYYSNLSNRAQYGHGWSDNLPYVSFSGYSVAQVGGGPYPFLGWCPVTSSYNFYDPNGESHMLNLAAFGVAKNNQSGEPTPQGCMNMFPGGSSPSGGDVEVSATTKYNCNGDYYEATNPPYPADCDNAMPSFTVRDLDGTTYSFLANSGQFTVGICCNEPPPPAQTSNIFPSQIEDRNGNIIQFTPPVVGGSLSPTTPITDTLGRTISTGSTYTVGGLSYTATAGTTTASVTFPSKQVYPLGSTGFSCDPNFVVNDTTNPFSVVTSIALPNGQAYTFKYDATYGLVNEIDYPDGGWVKYTWGFPGTPGTLSSYSTLAVFDGLGAASTTNYPVPDSGSCNYLYSPPVITQREVGYSKGSGPALTQVFQYSTTWDGTYAGVWDTKTTQITTTDNITNKQSITDYAYGQVLQPVVPGGPQQPSEIPVETQIKSFDWGNSSTPLKTVNKTWADQFRMTSEQTVWSSGPTSSEVIYCYEPASNLVMEKDEYDYGVATPSLTPAYGFPNVATFATCGQSGPTRRTFYAYFLGQSPCQTIVYDNNNQRAAETDVYLDGGSATCSSGQGGTQSANFVPGTHDPIYGVNPGGPVRGNATTVMRWLNTGTSPTTTYTYDETGQVLSMTDACGNTTCSDMTGTNLSHTTTYSYTDSPTGGNAYGQSNAYVTQITYPSANSITQQNNFSYDYATGNLISSTDANSQTTTYSYNDSLKRLTGKNYPDGGVTTISYNDTPSSLTSPLPCQLASSTPSVTTSQLLSSSEGSKTSVSVIDGMGHVQQTQLTSDPEGIDCVDTVYNGMGQVQSVSNPHRLGTSTTDGTTVVTYDALNRKANQTEPDGGVLKWSYSDNTTAYITAFTDEANLTWTRQSDSFDRLTKVIEPAGTPTSYTYSALNDLTAVTQVGNPSVNEIGTTAKEIPRTRSFTYDSLSRLITAQNPETGIDCYGQWSGSSVGSGTCQNGYDANGNLLYKTNANNVVMYYTYDNLNRLLTKYTTASVNGWVDDGYLYDQPFGNGIGRLTHTGSSTSGTSIGYDSMGRIILTAESTRDIPWSSNLGFTATYDLVGDLTSLNYPDGRKIMETWDGAGRLATIASPETANSAAINYISDITYTPTSAAQLFTLGSGITQTSTFNNRLQDCQIQVGAIFPGSSQTTSLLNKQYSHAQSPEPLCGNAASNNGNIWSIADNDKPGLTQTFAYDSWNRLTSAVSADGSYSQSYNIDSFGNMSPQNNGSTSINYSTNQTTNQLLRNTTDFQYDAAGNLFSVADPLATHYYSINALGQLYTIDYQVSGIYYYNGNDLRNSKTKPSGWEDYLYFNGQLAAELSSDGTWTDHIYANGTKIASSSNSDVRLHMSGVMPTGTGNFAQTGITAHYTVTTGDQLTFRTYVRNAKAQLSIYFSDSTSTSPYISSGANAWVTSVVNLGAIASGKTISYMILKNPSAAPAGQFDLMVADMSITRSDGTVTQIVGELPAGACTATGSTGITNLACVSEKVNSATDFAGPPQTTRFYLSDPLGTAQLEMTSTGYPLWKGEFSPFGQEIDSQTTANNYKFTGKERDTESGFDYFGARYYNSNMGRWISPDWAAKPEAVPYSDLHNPQSLNLYGYVNNNPLSKADPDGHCSAEEMAICHAITVAVSNGMNAGDAMQAAAQQQQPKVSDNTKSAGGLLGTVQKWFGSAQSAQSVAADYSESAMWAKTYNGASAARDRDASPNSTSPAYTFEMNTALMGLAWSHLQYLAADGAITTNGALNGVPILGDLPKAMLPFLQQQIETARQQYSQARDAWAANLERQSTHTEIVNPQ